MLKPNAQVCIRNAHNTHCAPDWRWEHKGNSPETLLLWIIQGGTARLTVGERSFDLQKGDVFIIPQWLYCCGEHDVHDRLRVPWALFQYVDQDGDVLPIQHNWKQHNWPLHQRPRHLELIETLFLKAIEARFDPTQGDTMANRWMECVLLELHDQNQQPPSSGPETELVERIQFLCNQIQAHPERPWRIDRMARNLHYSPDHFARLFQQVKQVSPGEFVIRARINAAKSLLRVSSHPIGRIADLLGYGDVYHFSKQFKQKVGVSPKRFREGR